MPSTYRIVRRAFGTWTVAEMFSGTWSEAMCRAMALQSERRDGEYDARSEAEPVGPFSGASIDPVQSAFAYL